MLPRRGVAYGVLLLTQAAIVSPRRSIDEWIGAARQHGSYLALATDLAAPAMELIDCGLVKVGVWVEISPLLITILDRGRAARLQETAQLLLIVSPPEWLRFAVGELGVDRDYIPEGDLRALEWLEPGLDDMLLIAYKEISSTRNASRAKAIGDAGELFVLAGLRYAGANVFHAAQFSDAYGYDIEVLGPTHGQIEVKAAGPKTAGRFHLSRNEYEACRRYGTNWRLLQVAFNSAAFVAAELNASHVDSVQELAADVIESVVPPDTEHFSWQESALLTLPPSVWRPSGLALDPNLKIPGFALQ